MPQRRIPGKRRRVLWAGLAAAATLAAARGLSLQGCVKPVRIVGGSMAPALLGPRHEIACGDCGYRWAVDALQVRGDDTLTCPNCGFAKNQVGAAPLVKGERVLIDRGAFWLRQPHRFELVAFYDETNRGLTVKRLAALPGEMPSIVAGDLFLGSQIVRKSLEQLRDVAVPVHDDRFRPRDLDLPPRWLDPDGAWSPTEDGYRYPGDLQAWAALRANPRFAWLTYHHWRCSPLPGLRTKDSPVLDDDGYNLGPPRQLNAITDLLLTARVATAGDGCLAVRLHDGREFFEIRLWPRRGEADLRRGEEVVTQATFSRQAEDAVFRIEAALCDRQVLAAIDGHNLFACDYCPATAPRKPSSQPLAIGAAGLSVALGDLIISRDVYYLPPPGHASWKPGEALGKDEFVLLGDNSAISLDSRTWKVPGLPRSRLIGPVLRWPSAGGSFR